MTLKKAERDGIYAQALALSAIVGQRAAARQLGLNEDTVCVWLHKAKKRVGGLIQFDKLNQKPLPVSTTDQQRNEAIEAALRTRSEATKLQLAIAADNASSKMAGMTPEALVQRDTAQAADSWSRAADRTHGWSAERAKAPVVQIANIHVPSPDDMQRDKDTDAKLDRITALLARSTLPSSKEGS